MINNEFLKNLILSIFKLVQPTASNNDATDKIVALEHKKKELQSYIATNQLTDSEIKLLNSSLCFCNTCISLLKDSNNISDIVSVVKNIRFLLKESNAILINPEFKNQIERALYIISDEIETKIILYSTAKVELDNIQSDTIPNQAFCNRIKKVYGVNYEDWVDLSDDQKEDLYLKRFFRT